MKDRNLIILLLIIVLLGLGYFSIDQISTKNIVDDFKPITRNEVPSTVNEEIIHEVNPETPLSLLSQESLIALANNANLFVTDISFSKEIEMTGDATPEALFCGVGANNSVCFLVSGTVSNPKLLSLKDREGISPVSLVSVGRVQHMLGYKLLPEENGFYLLEKESSDGVNFKCNGVMAYNWNINNRIFEYDKKLSDKYSIIECGDTKNYKENEDLNNVSNSLNSKKITLWGKDVVIPADWIVEEQTYESAASKANNEAPQVVGYILKPRDVLDSNDIITLGGRQNDVCAQFPNELCNEVKFNLPIFTYSQNLEVISIYKTIIK